MFLSNKKHDYRGGGKKSVSRSLYMGDPVRIINFSKHAKDKWLAGVVTDKHKHLTYLITLDDGRIFRRHLDHIRLRTNCMTNIGTPHPVVGVPNAIVSEDDHHPMIQLSEVPTTTAYKWWSCQVFRPANCCQHIPPNRFFDGFPDLSQFAAAKLTHYSSKPQRPSDSSGSWQRILLSGDVHPNPGPTTKYPCPVCARNVTSRGVSYFCNRCSGWVHSKCSGLQDASEYRRTKDWVCSSCNSPPTLPKLQLPPIPTQWT